MEIEKIIQQEFEKNKPEVNINDKNNVFIVCRITKQEALSGGIKKIKYNQICENGKKEKNIIDVKIPKGIQNNQKIIIYNNGNYVKNENKMSHLIIKIEIK